MLTVIDEFTCECLAIEVARRLDSHCVLSVLTDLMVRRGVPGHIRSDNDEADRGRRPRKPPNEFKAVREWIARVGAKTLFIEPGSPGRTATMRDSTAG